MSDQNKHECFLFVFYSNLVEQFSARLHMGKSWESPLFLLIRHALTIINTLKQMGQP